MDNSSSYWKSVLETKNVPEFNSSSYFNQSFVDRLKKAQENIDNLVKAENQANSKVQSSQDAYDTFKGEMRHYTDIKKSQENDFGVKTAMDEYTKSKDAIAATQSAINALPSNINANSNRVLTQSQREGFYQARFANYSREMGATQKISDVYEKVWSQARENSLRAAAAEYGLQQQTLMDFNKAWTSALNNWSTAKTNVLKAKEMQTDIESQYRQWQHQQYEKEFTIALKEREIANKMYLQALENEFAIDRANRAYNTTMTNADLEETWAKRSVDSELRKKELSEFYNQTGKYSGGGSGGGGGGSW